MTDYRESITSKLCAFALGRHSEKARDKIFDDYLAVDFMGEKEYKEVYEFIRRGFKADGELLSEEHAERVISEYLAPIPLSRARFCESRLKSFAEEHGEIQYVILGAGNDTFSFRCDNKNIRIFEIDHPVTQAAKLHKIQKFDRNLDNVRFVRVDLEKERMGDKLLNAGFDPQKRSFFSILGVSYYLTLPTFTEIISQISELSRPQSALVFDFPLKGKEFPPRVRELERLTHSLGEDRHVEIEPEPPHDDKLLIVGCAAVFTEQIFVRTRRPNEGILYVCRARATKYGRKDARKDRLGFGSRMPLRGGFTYGEISRLLFYLGFEIDEYLGPRAVEERYFKGRTDGLSAFENVSMLSAVYTGGTSY